jgi:hypothetical protein
MVLYVVNWRHSRGRSSSLSEVSVTAFIWKNEVRNVFAFTRFGACNIHVDILSYSVLQNKFSYVGQEDCSHSTP